MGVYELSGAGSVKTGRTLYTSMNANNQYGAMVPISSTTLTNSTTSDVTFSNIPQIYQDLMIVGFARRTDAAAAGNVYITPYYSGIQASPQSTTILDGNGSSASSYRYSNQDGAFTSSVPAASSTAGIFGSIVWHCLNYANTSTFKTSIARTAADTNGSGTTRLAVSLTRGTGGITTVNCSTFSGSAFLTEGTTFTLYGIRAVSS
jgi:hypothetical protein